MSSNVAIERPRVVILGAGFGGLSAAKALAKMPFDVALIHTYSRKLGGAALDAAHRLEQLGKLGLAKRRNDGAAVEAKLDQALGGELL